MTSFFREKNIISVNFLNFNAAENRGQLVFVPIKSFGNHNQFSANRQFFKSKLNEAFWNGKVRVIWRVRQYYCKIFFFNVFITVA